MTNRYPPMSALAGFEAAARHGSLTRAADELSVTQGAVSRQVQLLEEHCGVRLFERTRQGLQLTEAGEAYVGEVRPLLRRLELATDHLRTHHGRAAVLNLSVPPTFGSYWLVPRLPEFIAMHPEVTLNLATQIGPGADLRSRGIDAAIVYGAKPPDGCVGRPVLSLTLYPYAAPSLLKANAGKGATRVVSMALLQSTTLPTAWSDWMQTADVDGRACRYGPRYELMSLGLAAAIGGVGVALLPPWVAESAVRNRSLARVAAVGLVTAASYQLCHASAQPKNSALEKFDAWLATKT
jgi:LysR family transcriptional regulator, glycine cleavage system transcriptional activator